MPMDHIALCGQAQRMLPNPSAANLVLSIILAEHGINPAAEPELNGLK